MDGFGHHFSPLTSSIIPEYAENIKTPVLMISAGSDRVVSLKAQKTICARLANCRFIEIKDARHEILMETDAIRSKFRNEFDLFIN